MHAPAALLLEYASFLMGIRYSSAVVVLPRWLSAA